MKAEMRWGDEFSIQASGYGRSASRLAIMVLAVALGGQARAEIANSATASGTYDGAPVASEPSSVSIPVAPPAPALSVAGVGTRFDGNVVGDGALQAGDQLLFDVTVRNNGNVTLSGVVPEARSIAFNGRAFSPGDLALTEGEAVTLAPGAEQTFTFAYALAANDIYAAAGIADGVTSSWTAIATAAKGELAVEEVDAVATLPAEPRLSMTRSFTLTTDGGLAEAADPGDVITYSYVVTNTGNVPITDMHIVDKRENADGTETALDSSTYDGSLGDGPDQWNMVETGPAVFGANADEKKDDAVFGLLGVGGVVTFTHVHVVSQAEFDAQ